MASNIKHIVEPVLGWLFVIVVIVGLGAALLAATRPMVEVTGRIQVEKAH
jgi:hypothetical protein